MNIILHCIEYHEEYNFGGKGNAAKDIETLILQDADNLDAIGTIAISRAFTYGGVINRPVWIPEIPRTIIHVQHPISQKNKIKFINI